MAVSVREDNVQCGLRRVVKFFVYPVPEVCSELLVLFGVRVDWGVYNEIRGVLSVWVAHTNDECSSMQRRPFRIADVADIREVSFRDKEAASCGLRRVRELRGAGFYEIVV